MLISSEAWLARTTLQRTKWNVVSSLLTILSVPVPISVVQSNRLIVLRIPGSCTFFFFKTVFFSLAMHGLECTIFHSAVQCCKNTFRSICIMKKLSILVCLYRSSKPLYSSGYSEQIYIL